MTVNLKTVGKILAVVGAIASAVIGSVGTGTLPISVRTALVVIGGVVVAVERYLTTTTKTTIPVVTKPVSTTTLNKTTVSTTS